MSVKRSAPSTKPAARPKAAPKPKPKPKPSRRPAAKKAPAKRPLAKPKDRSRAPKPDVGSAAALQGPAAHLVRGELKKPTGNLTADKLSGPDDLRLRQISKTATKANIDMTRRVSASLGEAGVDAHVYGRAKTPESLFGKLRETPGMKLSEVKDISGVRADITPTKPGFGELQKAQQAAQDSLGDAMKLKADYIKEPNRWGYTGRIHSTVEANGLTHELQVGSKDVSKFIDQKLTNANGQSVKLHDATFYKGDLYGTRLPPHLEKQYTSLMGRISDANKAGKAVEDVPELARDLADFKKAAEGALPENIPLKPAAKLSTGAKVAKAAGKAMGGLGAVGGVVQAANGVQELRDGKVVEGGADVVGGTGNVIAGGALMAGRVGLGTTTGGAVAVVDGAKDIYVGIRDKNLEKGVVGTVKAGAGGAMIAGVATANPVLIAGGAVAYGGAVVYENRKAIGRAAKSVGRAVSRTATRATRAVGNAGRKAWGWVRSWF